MQIFFPLNANKLQQFRAEFGLLFGAICWGIIWYPYRLMDEAGVAGIAASFYTYGIAILFSSLYFFKDYFIKDYFLKDWRQLFNFPRGVIWLSLVAGWTNIAYVLAIIDGEVMRVMLLFYLSPIWTLILAHFWLKERTHLQGLGIIVLALIGALIMLFDFSAQKTSLLSYLPLPQNQAEWIALSSGIGFSITNVLTRKSTHLSLRTKSFAIWLGVFFMSFLMLLFFDLPIPAPQFFSFFEWAIMIFIALILISATWLVQYGVTKIPATRASVLFLFELVIAAIASYFLAHETMQWNEWLGGVLIILAGFLSATQMEKAPI